MSNIYLECDRFSAPFDRVNGEYEEQITWLDLSRFLPLVLATGVSLRRGWRASVKVGDARSA